MLRAADDRKSGGKVAPRQEQGHLGGQTQFGHGQPDVQPPARGQLHSWLRGIDFGNSIPAKNLSDKLSSSKFGHQFNMHV
jgi:hypothetical protein